MRLQLWLVAAVIIVLVPMLSATETGALDVSNAVIRAYREVLRRDPDSAGMDHHCRMLREGKDERWLRTALASSAEYRAMTRARQAALFQDVVVPLICLAALYALAPIFERKRVAAAVVAGAALVGTVMFFASIVRFAVNVPSWDDFDAILAYSNQPFAERLRGLIAPHNLHRLAATRLAAEGSRLVLGSVDFKFMTLVMNAALLGTGIVLWLEWKRKLPLRYFVLVPVLLFTPRAWVTMMHPMQYNLLLFFSIGAFYAAARVGGWRGTLAAAGCGVLAVFTMASGLFIFPVLLLFGIATTLPAARMRSARRPQVIVPALATAAAVLLYFTHNSALGSLPASDAFPAWPQLWSAIRFVILFAGAFFGEPLALPGGIAILACFAYATLRKAWNSCPVLYLLAAFILLNAAAAAVMRMPAGISPLDQRCASFSIMLIVACLGLALDLWPRLFQRRLVYALAAAGALFLCLDAWRESVVGRDRHRRILIEETSNWITSRHGLHYPRENMDRAGAVFDASLARGVYVLPPEIQERVQEAHRTTP